MNKTAIKNFAIWARVQLIESAKQRAFEYEITENGENKPELNAIGGRPLTDTEKDQRRQLIAEIKQKGFSQVMEEAAYTWFNRFIALRFMEVNGFLPSKVRVFTDENGAFKPEILKQAMTIELEGLDRKKVLALLDRQDNEELYKYLLITQCNALNTGLPNMFEKITNWTELLFPANLLRQDSVIGQMISMIPEEDWTDAVQIIGWLYQYYNSELKDETFALLKKNIKITKERIPAATQLFTPDWIVRYMVENSLGRLWYEGHSDFDKSQWKYYLDEADQEPEVEEQLKKIRAEYAQIRPEDIKVIDPCMGSGHILVYAFDVLMQIYISNGWSERDAAKSILENNLYGLDIDDRAGQLAYFAAMMKARKHSRRILNGEVKPNVLSIQDSNWMTDEFISYVAGKDANMKADLVMLRKTFRDAKEYGSILNVPAMQYDAIYERIDIINRSYAEDLFQAQYRTMAVEHLLPLVKQSQIMFQQYDVVVTNPPYMNNGGMGGKLSEYVKSNYPDSKADLFSVFIERCCNMLKANGFQAMITQHAWMFLGSFEKLRNKMLAFCFVNMAHLGARAFEEIGGEVVQTTAFIVRKSSLQHYCGVYCRLVEPNTQQGKEDLFLRGDSRYYSKQLNFKSIPESPIAYWISSKLLEALAGTLASDFTKLCKGMDTGDNNRFLRIWNEIDVSHLFYPQKWIPYNKGGSYRKWYGNNDYVLNWENDGKQVSSFKGSNIRNRTYYLRPGITWSATSSGAFACRYCEGGFIFDSKGCMAFSGNQNEDFYLMAAMNTKPFSEFMKVVSPTLDYNPGPVGRGAVKDIKEKTTIIAMVQECISISKTDWDSFETSWDFKKHPLI